MQFNDCKYNGYGFDLHSREFIISYTGETKSSDEHLIFRILDVTLLKWEDK